MTRARSTPNQETTMPYPRHTLALLLLAATAAAAHASTHAYVLTSDYSNGGVSVADLATRAMTRDVATVYEDAVERWYQGKLYVVNRYGADNVQVIDPAAGYATIKQFSVGSGSNPQDIALVSPTRAYVSRLGSPDLLIVNPETGATLGSVSLAAFADADGNPEPARMTLVPPFLFVALQRLTNFQPQNAAMVAVVDTRADTLYDTDLATPGVQAITLPARNPVTTFTVLPEGAPFPDLHLLIGCAGVYGAADGGIADIVVTGLAGNPHPAMTSAGLIATEAALGGDVVGVAYYLPDHSYAVVSDASFNTRLVAWDPRSGGVLGTVYDPGGFSIADAAVNDRRELWVCDNGLGAPGVRVFRAGADSLLAGPLDAGLPPVGVTFDQLEDVPAGVPAPTPPAFALARPTPNPALRVAHLALATPRDTRVRVQVFDMAGRRVATLFDGIARAGTLALDWDLKDRSGNAVAGGVYVVQADGGGARAAEKIVVMR